MTPHEPPADALALRRFCRALLELLDADGGGCSAALAAELARAVGAGVAEVADGLRQEVAAWDDAIAALRGLPARLLEQPPAAAALRGELETTRAAAARVVSALEALRGDEGGLVAAGAVADTAESQALLTVELPPRPEKPALRASRVFLRGEAHHKQREFGRAEELYTEAIGIDARFGPAYSRRGQVRLARGDGAAAVADFDAALSLDETAAEARWWRGDAHALAGRLDEAIADYAHSLEMRPELVRPRFNLAVALRRCGDAERALAEFAAVLEARPGHVGAHLNRGLIHRERGDEELARAEFRAALRHDPTCEQARQLLAVAVPVAAPPAPPRVTEPTKIDPGRLSIRCPRCGEPGQVPWDRLGRLFICGSCKGRFGVKADGKPVELVSGPDGKWVEAPPFRATRRRRRRRRLLVVGVVLAAVLFPAAGVAGWRAARGEPQPAERELPPTLPARAELFAQAWLCNDVRLMKRLTSPAQEKVLFSWYTRHRPPLGLRSPVDGTPPDGATIEVSERAVKPGQSVVRLRVGNPRRHRGTRPRN